MVGAEDALHRAKIGAFNVDVKRALFNDRVHAAQGILIPSPAGDDPLDTVCQILQCRLLQAKNRGSFSPRQSCPRRCQKMLFTVIVPAALCTALTCCSSSENQPATI
jgi:hypothetical protein